MISSLGFVVSKYKFALFTMYTDAGQIILSLYVVDMIITGDDVNGIWVLKVKVTKIFEMKDLSLLRYFLSIEVDYLHRDCLLSESKYIVNILERGSIKVSYLHGGRFEFITIFLEY